eukprot:scaffold296863_cov40-Tisochrysis_lutea.AAC.1
MSSRTQYWGAPMVLFPCPRPLRRHPLPSSIVYQLLRPTPWGLALCDPRLRPRALQRGQLEVL